MVPERSIASSMRNHRKDTASVLCLGNLRHRKADMLSYLHFCPRALCQAATHILSPFGFSVYFLDFILQPVDLGGVDTE